MAKNYKQGRDDMSPMIRSDKGAFANMPQSSFVKTYPENPSSFDGSYNDSLAGLDGQMSKDSGKLNGQKQKDRY